MKKALKRSGIILLLVTFLLQGLGNLLARRTFNRTLFSRRHRKQEGTV